MKGPAKSLKVHRGDSIHIEVQASYEEHSRKKVQGGSGILAAVSTLFSPAAAGIELVGASEGINEALAGATLLDRDKTGVPKAYLNYVVMNEDQQVIDQGFVPVSEAARIETGRRKKGKRRTEADSVAHETLAVDLDIEEEGYLYTYVSNESNWDVDVHFDEMAVDAASSAPLIVHSQDYYPHGLTHQQPLTNPSTDYLYNGMERVEELNLNVYSAAFRTYDPALGRWWQQDPVQDAMPGLSAYHQTYGNPVNYRDPLGLYGYGGGLNRHIGESAGEQWMREHNMGDGYTNPVFAQGPSYQQQQMNQFFSSLPAGKYQMGGDDDEVFRLSRFADDKYFSYIFYRSFFNSGRSILDSGVDPTYLQAGTNVDALLGIWSIASYSGGIYEEVRALSLAKNNLNYLRELSGIRNFHRGYKTARQATLLNSIANNTKMMQGIKLGARRMIGVGTVVGILDVANANPEDRLNKIGWLGADTAMGIIGLTGWGAPIAYFGVTVPVISLQRVPLFHDKNKG